MDKQNRGAHGFTSLEDLAAWKRDEFEWKLTAEKTLRSDIYDLDVLVDGSSVACYMV